MVRKRVLIAALINAVLALSGCGGGSTDTAGSAPASVSPSADSNLGTDPGTGTGTDDSASGGVGIDPGTGTGTDPGTGDGGTGTCGGTASGGACTGDDTGSGGTGGSDTGTGDTGGGDDDPHAGCNDIVTKCFDIGAAQVAKYKDNKQSAASYTFDDGYASSTTIASIFESFGARATFFIIPANVPDAQWAMWQDLSHRGHEIGNHSMHHIDLSDPTLTEAQLDLEINAAQKLIGEKIGIVPLSFAFPWHAFTADALRVAKEQHYAVRMLDLGVNTYHFQFFDMDHQPDEAQALADANTQLKNMVDVGGWFVAGGHGVDGDGWSPVSSNFLNKHLQFASQYASKLWIDTFLNVSRYRACRPLLTPEVTSASSSTIKVRLTGTVDSKFCTEPLTVTIPITDMPHGQVHAHTASGAEIPVKLVDGNLLVGVRPDDEVSVDITH